MAKRQDSKSIFRCLGCSAKISLPESVAPASFRAAAKPFSLQYHRSKFCRNHSAFQAYKMPSQVETSKYAKHTASKTISQPKKHGTDKLQGQNV